MRVTVGGAEHLGAADQVHAPDTAESLVETLRVDCMDLVPVLFETLGPRIERECVVPAQVLDIDHLEAAAFHCVDALGKTWDPPARKHVLADEELGFVLADVPDVMQHAEAARLEKVRVRL